MRLRTLIGIIVALLVVVSVAYLSSQNRELLDERFQLTSQTSLPVYGALLLVFLLGFVPAVSVLVTQTLKRDLARRRERRQNREAKSLKGTYRRALDFQADGQWGKAAAELEGVLAERPEDFSTLLAYGEVLRHQGKSTEALEVHRRASVLYPRSVAVLYQLAEDYEVGGDVEVARQIRDRVLRDFPGRGLQILRRRRNGAIGRREWREAGRIQERIEKMLAENDAGVDLDREAGVATGLAYQIGIDHLESERLEDASKSFTEILSNDPGFLPARIMLGETELLAGRDAAALEVWRQAFLETGSAVFLQRIEDHFIESAQPEAGIQTLLQLLQTSGDELLPRLFLGRLYARLEMHEEALKVLESLDDRIDRAPGFHYLLARIHERRGEMKMAVEELLACVTEAGIASAEYCCRVCRTSYAEWSDRCSACGSWNSVDLELEEDASTGRTGRRDSGPSVVYHGEFGRKREEA